MAREWARRYWRELLRHLQQEGIQLQELPPRSDDRFQTFEIGRRTFCLEAWFYVREQETGLREIGVRLRMNGQHRTAYFHLLKRQREEIERELGEPIKEWSYTNYFDVIYVKKSRVDVTDESAWSNQHARFASKLEKFNAVFRPRILTLNAADYDPEEALDDVEDVDPATEDIFDETVISDDFDDAEDIDPEEALAKASQSESNMPMHAYVVMIHLVSQGYSTFIEMRNVLCQEDPGTYYITILAYIFKKIAVLEDEWGESIPPITALVFNSDGNASKWACQEFTGSSENQPTLQQIAEIAASVAAYDKWDKVLEAFRQDAFSN